MAYKIDAKTSKTADSTPVAVTTALGECQEYWCVIKAGAVDVTLVASGADTGASGLLIAATTTVVSGPYRHGGLPYLQAAAPSICTVVVLGNDEVTECPFVFDLIPPDLSTSVAAILLATCTTIPALLGTPVTDLAADIAAISLLIGAPVVDVATDIAGIGTLIGTPSVDVITDMNALIGTPVADVSADLAVVDGNVDAILTDTGTTIPAAIVPINTAVVTTIPAAVAAVKLDTEVLKAALITTSYPTGSRQYWSRRITSAANAGAVNFGVVVGGDIWVVSGSIQSNGATTADCTSCELRGDVANQIIVNASEAVKANLSADGDVESTNDSIALGHKVVTPFALTTGENITQNLAGTGATAVDWTITVCYEPITAGAHLVNA